MHIFSLCLYVGIFAGLVTSAALGLQRFHNLTSPFSILPWRKDSFEWFMWFGACNVCETSPASTPNIPKHFHPDGWSFQDSSSISSFSVRPVFKGWPLWPGAAGTSNFRKVRNLSHHRPEARDAWRWLDVRHPEKVTDDGEGIGESLGNHYDLHDKVMMNSWGIGPRHWRMAFFFRGLLNTPLESRLWFVSWHRIMITTVRSLWRPTSALEWPRFLRISSYCWWKK